MNPFELVWRGWIAGLIIAAPVGPVNVFCVRQTLAKGWKSGLLSGLGAAIADTLYGAIAAFSITFIIRFLLREQPRIRLAGGMLLMVIGGVVYFTRRNEPSRVESHPVRHSGLVSTFLLNLTNPTVVMSFLAVLAVVGVANHRHGWSTLFVVIGIFGGSMMWWALLTGVVHRLRHRFTPRIMIAMNRAAGAAIGGFGAVMIATAGR